MRKGPCLHLVLALASVLQARGIPHQGNPFGTSKVASRPPKASGKRASTPRPQALDPGPAQVGLLEISI